MVQPEGDLKGEGITQPANKLLLFTPTAHVATHAWPLIDACYTILGSAQLNLYVVPRFKYTAMLVEYYNNSAFYGQ